LNALAWILSDPTRAERFLAVTGLDADGLRAAIGEPATHLAVLDFLCAHEPDLIAAAEALGLAPAALAATRERFAP
jgi:adenine/guanine phosphoribosyltransferase-like PRPP-binding protein